jgi:hypothetical protein
MRTSDDPRFDAEKRERAKELYEGMDRPSVRAVAEKLDLSVSRTWTLLDEAGVDLNPQGRPSPEEVHDHELEEEPDA